MNWRKWLDECGLACKGIVLATREKHFWLGFVPAFLIFDWLINMLSSGFEEFIQVFTSPLPDSLRIIGENFLAIFGVNQHFLDWLPTFALCALQGCLIGLITLLWHKKRLQNSGSLERAGIVTGLIALGAGCPTCGTTLITALVAPIFTSTSSIAAGGLTFLGILPTILTWAAIIVALFALKRLGLENYVIIKNEAYLARQATKAAKPKSSIKAQRKKPKAAK